MIYNGLIGVSGRRIKPRCPRHCTGWIGRLTTSPPNGNGATARAARLKHSPTLIPAACCTARSGSGRPPGCAASLLGLNLARLQLLSGWLGVCEHAGVGRSHPRVGEARYTPSVHRRLADAHDRIRWSAGQSARRPAGRARPRLGERTQSGGRTAHGRAGAPPCCLAGVPLPGSAAACRAWWQAPDRSATGSCCSCSRAASRARHWGSAAGCKCRAWPAGLRRAAYEKLARSAVIGGPFHAARMTGAGHVRQIAVPAGRKTTVADPL
jgi:hypothetical protein